MPNASGAVDLGSLSSSEREAVEQLAEKTGTTGDERVPIKEVDSAFTVIIERDGSVGIHTYDDEDLAQDREITADLVYGAIAIIKRDIEAGAAGQQAFQLQMVYAQQMRQQQEAQRLQQGLGPNMGRI